MIKFIANLLNKLTFKKIWIMRVLFAEGDPAPAGGDPKPQDPKPADPKPQPTINFEELIARAREQEKNKLYPQIEKLKKEKDDLVARINDLLVESATKDSTVKELEKKITKLSEGKADPEEVKKLNKKVTDLEKANTDLQKQIDEAKLADYKKEKIAEAKGQVIEDFITGSTKEEIDASIVTAKAKYVEYAQKFGIKIDANNPAQQTGNPAQPAGSPAGSPAQSTQNNPYSIPVVPAGSNLNGGTNSNITLDSVKGASYSQWKEMRKQLGFK